MMSNLEGNDKQAAVEITPGEQKCRQYPKRFHIHSHSGSDSLQEVLEAIGDVPEATECPDCGAPITFAAIGIDAFPHETIGFACLGRFTRTFPSKCPKTDWSDWKFEPTPTKHCVQNQLAAALRALEAAAIICSRGDGYDLCPRDVIDDEQWECGASDPCHVDIGQVRKCWVDCFNGIARAELAAERANDKQGESKS
jgi:hypothetical protein